MALPSGECVYVYGYMGAYADMVQEFVLTSCIDLFRCIISYNPNLAQRLMIAEGYRVQAERISPVLNRDHMFPSHAGWYPQVMGLYMGKVSISKSIILLSNFIFYFENYTWISVAL